MIKSLLESRDQGGKLGLKRRHVVEGTIVKNGKNSDNYQVTVQMPYTKKKGKNGSLYRTLPT